MDAIRVVHVFKVALASNQLFIDLCICHYKYLYIVAVAFDQGFNSPDAFADSSKEYLNKGAFLQW